MNPQKQVSLNLNVRGLGQSATLAIKDRCRALRRSGREVYDFGLGQSPFPVPEPVVEALRAAAGQKDYLPVMGLPELREAVAAHHRRTDGLNVSADNVLVGPGSKELMFLVQLVYYGEIMLTPPCWVSYWPQARILGRRFSLLHSDFVRHWKIDAAQLAQSIELVGDDHRPRLLVLNYPSNPTGSTYDEHELKALAEVARRFGLIVLSDEIYGQLHYHGRHVSIARFYPEGTIVSSGLSKWCGAGGWRLGTFTFPNELDWLANALATVASETYTSVSAPIQHAAIRAFSGCPLIEDYLAHTRRILAAVAQRICPILNEAGVRVHEPDGAFYLFLDFNSFAAALAGRSIADGRTLCERLLAETGVAMLPGAAFGRGRRDLTARLAFVDFDGAAALEASRGVGLERPLPAGVVERCCARVVDGVRRIAEWAAS
ncbi:MAG: aminotransferase class I/II-fold pyridoxal phosphate-dependent enzyme [Phycisphaerae bacterium]|nr:aminotransferase class I/II-fold pyridoxal phosphate-dependent enzyme [Phycisphaerae bacterium]MCZ2398979.1 aminotransferase class I/II-fold pyridoxal phosphate-dependent enzyme [Phycisphaerae bacterium]